MNWTFEEYDYETNCSQCADGWPRKINRIIENEVTRRLTERQRQIESDNEYYKTEMFKAKNKLRDIKYQVESYQKDAEKIVRDAVKIAQREYWFDCAVGDTVYLIDYDYIRDKCQRCDGDGKIAVIIDGIEVNAECPICGTYAKKEKLTRRIPKIIKGKVERLEIELTNTNKWVYIWLDDGKDRKLNTDVHKVFRTLEEAEVAFEEEKAKAGGAADDRP